MKSLLVLTWGAALLAPINSEATLYTYAPIKQGWYINRQGVNLAGNSNYIAGVSQGNWFRDWFVFDLSSAPAGTIASATFTLFNPANGYTGPNSSETFRIGSVSLPIANLGGGNFIGSAGFATLGNGTLWGTQTVSAADNGANVNLSLNAAFGANAASILGSGSLAFGGSLVGDDSFTQDRTIFGFTGYPDQALPQLTLDIVTVPEPSSLALLVGLFPFALRQWRKR